MQRELSTTNPGMLIDVPYAYLIKYPEDEGYTYEVFYAIEVADNYVAQDTQPVVSGNIVFVTVNLLYQDGATGGVTASHQVIPTKNDNNEDIVKVEVIAQKYPSIIEQPQRSGVIIINYKDADE